MNILIHTCIFCLILISIPTTNGIFFDLSSVALRNARWLHENRLNWYHSYVPDVLKLLTKGSNEDDDEKPGYDPGDVPSVKEIHSRLRDLCHKSAVFSSMNLTRDCAMDLRFLVCSGTNLTNALVGMASGYCKTLNSLSSAQQCLKNVTKQLETNLWTSKYLDSFGKISGGILSGNYMHLGSYQQCVQVNVKRPKTSNQQRDFNGKYCHATFSMPLSPTRANLATTCYGKNFTQACAPISNSYNIRWGFCVPQSCNIREANGLMYYILYATNLTLCPARPLVLCVEQKSLSSDPPAIVMTSLCVILLLLIAVSTIYDLVDRRHLTKQWLGCFGKDKTAHLETTIHSNVDESQTSNLNRPHGKAVNILLAFSIYTNTKILLNTKEPKKRRTRFLDGIRVLNMAWVVLAQVHLLLIYYIGNIPTLFKMPSVLSFQAINNSSFSTDTFLLLAGFFIANNFWNNVSDNENWPKRYLFALLKRLFRILPVYMFILGMATIFWSYIGEGPMWMTAQYSPFGPFFCKFTWWLNLLFVNNFLFLEYPCMPWTWHVAVEMQLHVFALFLLIVYKKRPLAGFLISIVLIVLSMILNGIVLSSYDLAPSLLASANLTRLESINDYYAKIFIKPYMRWNPYLIGIFLAYVLRRTERRQDSFGLKYLRILPINNALWAAIIVICSLLVYGPYNFAVNGRLGSVAVVVYGVLARTIWSLTIAMLILLCSIQKGGLLKWFLSWSLWTPLSRLTYCVFLLHVFVIVFFYGTSKEWLQFNFGNMVYFWLSSLIISYGFGAIACVCVEMPFTRIGQLFFHRPLKQDLERNVAQAEDVQLLEFNDRPR